jgi:hypothetical protein
MLREAGRRVEALEERLAALLGNELLWWALIGGGIVLRVRQYAAHLSLGNDEAALARNIVERSFVGLTQPLDYRQGAPVLFLFVQKAIVAALGNKDFVLELFPFAAALLALYLFQRIAKKQIGIAGLAALAAFAVSLWLIYYSANPKQYGSDVLAALLLVYLADRCSGGETRPRDFLLLGAAGALAVWLSHPAAFMLPGIGLVVAAEHLHRKDWARSFWAAGMSALWVISFGVLYVVSLRNLAKNPYLLGYWLGAFMPMPPWSNLRWFAEAYRSLLEISLGRTDTWVSIVWLLLLAIGGGALLARKRGFAVIVLAPFVVALAASALQKYPFQQRLVLFLAPFVYLLMAEGVRQLYGWAARGSRPLALAACVGLLVVALRPMAVSAKRNFFNPPHPYDMRTVVEYLRGNLRAGDSVFVSGGGETFAYYAGSYELHPASTRVNNSHRVVRYYVYMDTLAKYAGQDRVWIIFAHFEENSHEYERYAKYLNRVGEVKDMFQAGYARAYLCKFDP